MQDARTLNKRYETVAWGAFFILLGVTSLIPGLPSGLGTLGIGIIMLGLNLLRYLAKIPTSGFTLVVGLVAVVLGAADMLRSLTGMEIEAPFFPLLLIVIGVIWLARGVVQR